MGQVNIRINGQPYELACDDGQENHLRGLAEMIDRQVTDLVQSVGNVGESRLLLMAALLICDELTEARQRLQHTNGHRRPAVVNDGGHDPEALADMLEDLADRLERLASRFGVA